MADTAVLICRGCDIGSALDVPALERVATDHEGVAQCRSVPCLCDERGEQELLACLSPETKVLVVAACSSRFHTRRFSFPSCRTERVSLRELVVWSHEANHEDTQMLAEDSLRMGLVRSQKAMPLPPEGLSAERSLLVVGGGPAGIAAACGAAKAGYRVVLVEKEAALGGWHRVWQRTLPSRPPYRDLETGQLEPLLRELEAEPRIITHLSASVTRIAGQPGQFDVELDVAGKKVQERVGAVVQATGWKPYDAARLSELGYGRCKDVITSTELERQLAEGPAHRPSDGKRAERIAFVQCAGSRDPQHLAYCSHVCCRVTLKQALWARELAPECTVYVLAKDVRTPGLHEDFYRRAQEDPGILFTKAEVTDVSSLGPEGIRIEARDRLLGEEASGGSIELAVDLVVLATGMVPVSADGEALRELRDARKALAAGTGSQDAASERVSKLAEHEGTELLNLAYRQGPDLPVLRYGFPDSHFICFPYESRRTGIYVAGCARAPNDLVGSRVDGEGAALKAIQAIEHASTGETMHPRWGDPSRPVFSLQRCTQCKRCTEECPFGTLDEDEKGTPQLNPSRCRRCGICLGACPERVVAFADYSIDIVSSMIKAVHVPDEFEEKPRILVLLCENDAYPALEMAGLHRRQHSAFVRTIPVRCLGSVNVVWIADALAQGFDGVLLLGCKPGEDSQCHFIRGSDLMGTRSENVKQKLQQLALENERVRVDHVALSDYLTVPRLIDGFVERIQELGMNPFKGV